MPLSINMYSGWKVHRCINYNFNLFENGKNTQYCATILMLKGFLKEGFSIHCQKYMTRFKWLIISLRIIFAQVVEK